MLDRISVTGVDVRLVTGRLGDAAAQIKPETFDFLGLTHCCSANRSGGFQILRLTVKKRMRATLLAIRDELKRRRHESVQVVGQWLTRVVTGYFNYHAMLGNLIRLGGVRLAVCRLWRQALKRRRQRHRLQWSRYGRLADLYIPRPRNAHLYPEDRFASHTRGRTYAAVPHVRIWAGVADNCHPYRDLMETIDVWNKRFGEGDAFACVYVLLAGSCHAQVSLQMQHRAAYFRPIHVCLEHQKRQL